MSKSETLAGDEVEAAVDRRVQMIDGLVERNVGGKTFLLTSNS